MSLFYDIFESAKSRAWRACVLACLTCLRACVLTCLACLRAHVLGVLTYLRAYVGVLACVSACLFVLFALHFNT